VSVALWRRLDTPGHDSVCLESIDDGWRLRGSAVFRHDRAPVRLDYTVECDPNWKTRRGAVQGWVGAEPVSLRVARSPAGVWLLNDASVHGLDGCVDLDFGFSPATNALQLRRIGLAVGVAADVPVAWLDVPGGSLRRLEQRYERVAPDRYAYEAPEFGYRGVLVVRPDGFAREYPGLWSEVR